MHSSPAAKRRRRERFLLALIAAPLAGGMLFSTGHGLLAGHPRVHGEWPPRAFAAIATPSANAGTRPAAWRATTQRASQLAAIASPMPTIARSEAPAVAFLTGLEQPDTAVTFLPNTPSFAGGARGSGSAASGVAEAIAPGATAMPAALAERAVTQSADTSDAGTVMASNDPPKVRMDAVLRTADSSDPVAAPADGSPSSMQQAAVLMMTGDGTPSAAANPSTTATLEAKEVAAVPEPASWVMMIAGFALVGIVQRGVRRTRLRPA